MKFVRKGFKVLGCPEMRVHLVEICCMISMEAIGQVRRDLEGRRMTVSALQQMVFSLVDIANLPG